MKYSKNGHFTENKENHHPSNTWENLKKILGNKKKGDKKPTNETTDDTVDSTAENIEDKDGDNNEIDKEKKETVGKIDNTLNDEYDNDILKGTNPLFSKVPMTFRGSGSSGHGGPINRNYSVGNTYGETKTKPGERTKDLEHFKKILKEDDEKNDKKLTNETTEKKED